MPKDGKKGTEQKAIIELLCNPEKAGWESEDDPAGEKWKRDEDEGDEKPVDGDQDDALKFVRYEPESIGSEAWDVLRLTWESKYACEDTAEKAPT
jgi:autophagy-related protein 27